MKLEDVFGQDDVIIVGMNNKEHAVVLHKAYMNIMNNAHRQAIIKKSKG